MVVRDTWKAPNAGFPGPQTRGSPKRPDLSKPPAWTIGPRSRIPPSMYVFSDDPPPDLCDWAHVRQAPGPGTYHPNFDHVKQSTLRSDFAPPIHWPDGDGIPAGDLLRKYRNPTRRELFTSGSEMRSLLRESLRPSAQRAMSAASGTHSTHLPTLPRANFSTLKNDLPGTPDQLARSWHGFHHRELRAQPPLPPREVFPPPFGPDILKPRVPIQRSKTADPRYITPREIREYNWDCRSIRHPRPPTSYSGRLGSP